MDVANVSQQDAAGGAVSGRATLNEQGPSTTSTQLVVIGCDFRHATVELREQLAFADDQLAAGLTQLTGVASEGVILSTCNRVELYAVIDSIEAAGAVDRVADCFAAATGVTRPDLDAATVALTGDGAVRHLFRVATGLESMVLGEPQILGQLRDALAAAQEARASGPILSRLFTEALRVGKLARTQTEIARNKTSIAHAAVALAAREFAAGCPILVALDRMDLTRLPCPSPIAHSYSLRGRTAVVVGAGAMGTLAAKLLRAGDIGRLLIINRTPSRADDLATRTGGEAWPLARLPEALAIADLAIVATSGAEPSLTRETLSTSTRRDGPPLVMIDVGVPRGVEPSVGDDPRVLLRDVDDLEQIAATFRSGQAAQVIHVEHLIADAVRSFHSWLHARRVAPTITALRTFGESIRDQELARALARLSHLSERDRQVVAALAVGVTNKLLHAPTAGLTRVDNEQCLADASALARLFNLAQAQAPVSDLATMDDLGTESHCPARTDTPARATQ